ncbi:MAG: type II secretion system protein [Limisphaerales bacterium]
MNRKRTAAFTRTELAVVIAAVALLTLLWLPAHALTALKTRRLVCADNLKRQGVAFQLWADKKDGRYPMSVPGVNGGPWLAGAMGTGKVAWNSDNYAQYTYQNFAVMSNELATPKAVNCPADSRNSATNFATQFIGTTGNQFVSYFVGLAAFPDAPRSFLTGDCNLGTAASQYLQNITYALGTNSPNLRWTERMHANNGNILLSDGSVELLTSAQLREAIRKTGGYPSIAGQQTAGTPNNVNVVALP